MYSLTTSVQAVMNYHRKSVVGMSFDYQYYNIIGYSCYSVCTIDPPYSRMT